MEKPVKGDVVVVSFPFSDLSNSKRRPALVLAVLEGADVVLCQITSKQTKDRYAIPAFASQFFCPERSTKRATFDPTNCSRLTSQSFCTRLVP